MTTSTHLSASSQQPSVCVNCGLVSHTQPTFIKSNIMWLSYCKGCNQTIDHYVEFNWVLLSISFLLLRPSLYIHLSYTRLCKVPMWKILSLSLCWCILTAFAFSLGAQKKILLDTLSFPSVQINPSLPLQTFPPSTTIVHPFLPSSLLEHAKYLSNILMQSLPAFNPPANFVPLLLVDLFALCLLTIFLPLYIHIQRKNNHSTSYQQTLKSFVRCIVSGLSGRFFFLISLFLDIDTRIYLAVQIAYATLTLAITLCTFFHIAPGFYSVLDLSPDHNDSDDTSNQNNHHSPHLHQTDLFSFWNNTIPVLSLIILYILPLYYVVQHLQPDFDLGVSWFFYGLK